MLLKFLHVLDERLLDFSMHLIAWMQHCNHIILSIQNNSLLSYNPTLITQKYELNEKNELDDWAQQEKILPKLSIFVLNLFR